MKQFMNVVNFILGGFVNICFVLVVLLAIYIAVIRGMNYGKSMVNDETSSKQSKEIIVAIPEGSSTQEIAAILKENGLIKNDVFFLVASKIKWNIRYVQIWRF